MRRDGGLDVVLKGFGKALTGFIAVAQHNMSLDNGATFLIRNANHRTFGNGIMRQQRRLHFGPGDIVARRNDHIVVARGKVEISGLVAHETVAGDVPSVLHIFALPLAPEVSATGRAANGKPSDFTGTKIGPVRADDLRLIAGYRPAGAGRRVVVEPVGDEDMKQFRRPDPVKHRLAGLRHPFVIDRRRQRLASRHRGAQRRQVGAILHRRQHYAIGGWRSETDCRPILLDHLDEIGRRSGLEQYRSGPEAKGKDS